MTRPRNDESGARARRASRRLLVQALYQHLLGGQPWQELHAQFSAERAHTRADAVHFRAALESVCATGEALDVELARHSDLPTSRLDPVEHAILRLGLWELGSRADIPYRVVISEAVDLAKRFGATDGHRYVNAVLDHAARSLRPLERGAVA